MKSPEVRSKTGESCPSLESRTWKSGPVLRASTQLLSTPPPLRLLLRQELYSTTEGLLDRLAHVPDFAAELIIPTDCDGILKVTALIERFGIDERRTRFR